MRKATRQRVPKLRFTANRGIGWYVSYRDRATRTPSRHRFRIAEREREPEARLLYHAWVLQYLGGPVGQTAAQPTNGSRRPKPKSGALSGSILEVATSLNEAERARVRKDGEPRRRGSIASAVFRDRKKQTRDFLEFLNDRHGVGAVASMRLCDLSMDDVEAYNALIARKFSGSQVAKRMQIVKAIIDRAGRPEHNGQILTWNWDSRDVAHGTPTKERCFPTLGQLRRLLIAADLRGRTMIWLGLGLGLGAKDLAVIRVGQITKDGFDLRRAKTGVERYGETPYLVWLYVSKYQTQMKRPPGELLFVTRNGVPLVQSTSNAVTQWWAKLGARIRKPNETTPGFYTLRHLGATEFGSRSGTSIGDVKRWLGHAASSHVADLYMRPVKPEYREVVNWIRQRLLTRTEPRA